MLYSQNLLTCDCPSRCRFCFKCLRFFCYVRYKLMSKMSYFLTLFSVPQCHPMFHPPKCPHMNIVIQISWKIYWAWYYPVLSLKCSKFNKIKNNKDKFCTIMIYYYITCHLHSQWHTVQFSDLSCGMAVKIFEGILNFSDFFKLN